MFIFTCLVFKTTCIDRGKPLREGAFSFTRRTLFPPLNKRNTRDEAKGLCSISERYVGELGVRCLSTQNGGQYSRQQSHIGLPLIPLLVYPLHQYCFDSRVHWFEAPLNSNASNDLRKYFGLHHRITPGPSYFFSPRLTKSWYLCLGHRPKGSELDSTSAGSRSPYIN